MVHILCIVLVMVHGILSNGEDTIDLLEATSFGHVGQLEGVSSRHIRQLEATSPRHVDKLDDTSSRQGEDVIDLAAIKDLINAIKKLNMTKGPRCPPPYSQVLDSCYYTSQVSLTWNEARKYCQGMEGDLASPKHLYALKSFIFNVQGYRITPGVFLGGVKNGAHNWHWLDGRPIQDSYWYHHEPNNYYGKEACLEMRLEWHPTLNDEDCMKSQAFVCQFHLPE